MAPWLAVLAVMPALAMAAQGDDSRPLFRVVDLDRDESREVELADGSKARVKLLDVEEERDALRSAIRDARVKVEINGQVATLLSANYRLPVKVGGVQVDCPVTRGYYKNCDPFEDSWGLDREVRLRLWPEGASWTVPGTFAYPIKQRWFASATQMGNEPSFVDGGDAPTGRPIYYHSGLDIGGCEGLAEVVSACDGVVVSSAGKALAEYPEIPFYKRADYDYVYVVDSHGWFYRYAHLKSIDPAVRPGKRIKMGQRIGLLGKEGSSGGWSHLHFDIKARQPSGKWGIQEAYAFLWEAYLREHKPSVVAVARPHHLIRPGETVVLEGSRSWCAEGQIARYEWTFSDGSTAAGPRVNRTYEKPGEYSEVLKVVDDRGHVDYDFAVVLVIDKNAGATPQPTIHASYAPTQGIQVGDAVSFKVRTFFSEATGETWDFGDGTPGITVRSDANAQPHAPNGYATIVHRFVSAGHHLVRVEHTGKDGARYTVRLHVTVDEPPPPTPGVAGWERWLNRKVLSPHEASGMMQAFLERQLQPLPLPATRAEWLARRDVLRREVLTTLGIDDLVPAKWDLALKMHGTIRRDGYRIEKITFESYPGMAVPALLYIPEGVTGRVPGIVSISGHTTTSKAADYVQQRNVNLALRGCVVLAYDYHGYGDRKTGNAPHSPTGDNSHDLRQFSYSRRSAAAIEVLDAIRAVDVLEGRADVDPARLGFTGESGGGNSTYWVAAVDPRVKLAVPVSSVTTFDYWIRTDANWEWHQRPAGIRRIADIGTLLALHAPNPLVIISSKHRTDDLEFPVEEAEKSFRWARHVYGLLGAEDAVTHYESTTAHGYQEDKREQLYRAVERRLQPPHPHDGKELPAKVERLEHLAIPLPERNATFREIFDGWVKPLPRLDPPGDPDLLRVFLRDRLGWTLPFPAVKAEYLGYSVSGPWSVKSWILETEPGIHLPVLLISREGSRGPITLVPGRDRRAIARALESGGSALALDLRGVGEMDHGQGGNYPWKPGPPWSEVLAHSDASVSNWAWFAGRPWAGMWALDLVQAARFCRNQLSAQQVAVSAGSTYGWPALLAGAAAPDLIDSGDVTLPRTSQLQDLRSRGDHALADVPGLLERLDVPQLRALWPGGTVHVP